MQFLAIDRELFMMAFGRDVDYHDTALQRIWLNRRTGDVFWLYECDEGAVGAFRDFQEAQIASLAEGFLRENGIVPEWR